MAGTARRIVGYGLSDALPNIPRAPINAKRAPTTADTGYIPGQLWVEGKDATGATINTAWILVSIIGNSANWLSVGGGAGAGVFASLLVSPGPTDLEGTFLSNGGTFTVTSGTNAINISADAAATAVNIGTGAAAKTVTVGSSSSTSALTLQAGSGALALTTAATGTITLGTAAMTGTITIGPSTAGQTINIGTGAGATQTNLGSATGGNRVNIASNPFQIAGPVFIYTGAGAPAGGNALHIGDIWINTAATVATDRMYIATAVGNWTNVTCAA